MADYAHRQDFTHWLRSSAPYIPAHQGRTFVLYLDDELMMGDALSPMVSDLALLSRLGINLVVVTGARLEVDRALKAAGIKAPMTKVHRPTDAEAMRCVQAVACEQRVRLERLASMGRPSGPERHMSVRITSGNYVIGRPLGIIDGINYGFAGLVRRVRSDFIKAHLATGTIVHIDCLGYAITTEVFNLNTADLAAQVAVALGADKLIMMTKAPLFESDGATISELDPSELENFLAEQALTAAESGYHHIKAILQAVRAGVPRAHVLNYDNEDALLNELFSHQGSGTQIAMRRNEKIRTAGQNDISDILSLIEPLERSGVLVRRSRERLEQEISHFIVMELDGLITGCAALYPLGDPPAIAKMGELACLVTHPDYQRQGIGEALLAALEKQAKTIGMKQLCTLTTQTSQWFLEQGFAEGDLSLLPDARRLLYNFQRGSKVLMKEIGTSPAD